MTGRPIHTVKDHALNDDQPDDQDIRHVRIHVTGHVQGVGFRQTARQNARKLGIDATAENQADGSVIIETRGPRERVEKLIHWASHGPALARVDNISVTEIE